jgi:hypothetical protein
LVIAHGPHTGIEIEFLSQRHVQRAKAAPNRRRQRTFDRNHQFLDGLQRLGGKIIAIIELCCLLAQIQLAPVDLALVVIGLCHCRIPDPQASAGDVRADAITFHITQDGIVRNLQTLLGDGDLLPVRGDPYLSISHVHLLLENDVTRYLSADLNK